MNIEIHDAIQEVLRRPAYRQITINSRTGKAVAGAMVQPQAVVVRPSASSFDISRNRRDLGLDKIQSTWVAEVEVAGLVFFDDIEELLSTPLQVQVDGRRPLIVVLASANYGSPPDQSPSSPSQAVFNFQVFPPTLRN